MKRFLALGTRVVAPVVKTVTAAGYLLTIGMLVFWGFVTTDGARHVYAQDRANPVKQINKTAKNLDAATKKLVKKGGEALAVHVISVHSRISEDTLLARSEPVNELAAAAIVARVTTLSLDDVLVQVASGTKLGTIVVNDGVATSVAQTLLSRAVAGVNENTRAAKGGLTDSDSDGIPNAMDDDVDGDGTLNRSDDDVDDDGTPNATDDDVDGDDMDNSGDDDIDGDHDANGDDDDTDGDGMSNGTDDDDDGDDIDDSADDDSDGDGVDDQNEDEGNGNGNTNGNDNNNGNGNGNDNGNDNGNGNGNGNSNGNSNGNDNGNSNGNSNGNDNGNDNGNGNRAR